MDYNISLTEEELGIIKYGGVVSLLSSDGTTIRVQLERNAACGLIEKEANE